MSRTSANGQVLADLVAEFAESPLEIKVEKRGMDGKSVDMISLQDPLSWRVYIDSATNQRRSRVGLVLVSPKKITIEKSLRLDFLTTNNDHGSKYGRKGSRDVFRLKVGRRPGEGRVGSKRCKNAMILKSS